MATLEEVNMTNVLNFDTDAACMHLATLVDKASRLNKMDVNFHKGNR